MIALLTVLAVLVYVAGFVITATVLGETSDPLDTPWVAMWPLTLVVVPFVLCARLVQYIDRRWWRP